MKTKAKSPWYSEAKSEFDKDVINEDNVTAADINYSMIFRGRDENGVGIYESLVARAFPYQYYTARLERYVRSSRIKCPWCGQYGEAQTACAHCGAPIGEE